MPFFINRSFENQLQEMFASAQAFNNVKPINLGGTSGPGGGYGGPPGGFFGQLTQNRIAYDSSELAASGMPASGWSIIDNLNHIRGRITVLEDFIATRLTTTERNALTPINGMIIYNTTDEKFQGYENSSWTNLI
jgi:hypothetical protein